MTFEQDDERWLVRDTDHHTQGTHLPSFLKALQRARDNGIFVALSKPAFDLWLLLHHVEETEIGHLKNAAEVGARLRAILGGYDKTNIRQTQFPLSAVVEACYRAERLDAIAGGGDIPRSNTTRVYKLWKSIASKAHPTQLPFQLRKLCS